MNEGKRRRMWNRTGKLGAKGDREMEVRCEKPRETGWGKHDHMKHRTGSEEGWRDDEHGE